jgi:hypothetical protein
MDEKPLIGEPGSFLITQTKPGHEKTPSQSSSQLKQVTPAAPAKNTSNTNTPTPSPLEVKTSLPDARKASQSGQKSPTTPGGSAGGPNKEKLKRRKSKAPASGQP